MNKHMNIVLGALLLLSTAPDASAQWNVKPSGTTNGITAVKFTDATTGFACGDFNTILKTTNGGATWQPVANGSIPPASFLSIDALSASKVFVARNGLYVTEDGGASWSQWGNWNNTAYSIQSIKAVNDSTAFITKGGNILKTTDKGVSWTTVYYFPDLTGPMIFTGNNDTAFAVSGRTWDNVSYGTIHRSVDGGGTWTDLALNTPQITAVHFRSGHVGYFIAFDKTLHKTVDGGTTWTSAGSITVAGADYITGLLFTDDFTGYAISLLGFIYKTTDGGANWAIDRNAHKSNGNYDVPLSALTAAGTKHIIVVGNTGTVIKNDGTLSVPGTKPSGLRFYPNPVMKYLTVELEATASYEHLSVYDMAGRLLSYRDISGQRSIQVDMQQYGSGNYIVEVAGKAEKHAYRVAVL